MAITEQHEHFFQSIMRDMGQLQAEVKLLHEEILSLRQKQDSLMAQANRWRGGFIVILGLGAVISWMAQFITNLIFE